MVSETKKKDEPGTPAPEIPLEAIENFDAALPWMPSDYELDVMAAELLDRATQYKTFTIALRAARNGNDHQRAVQIEAEQRFVRNQCALLTHLYKAKGIEAKAAELAQVKADAAARNRKAFQEQKPET